MPGDTTALADPSRRALRQPLVTVVFVRRRTGQVGAAVFVDDQYATQLQPIINSQNGQRGLIMFGDGSKHLITM